MNVQMQGTLINVNTMENAKKLKRTAWLPGSVHQAILNAVTDLAFLDWITSVSATVCALAESTFKATVLNSIDVLME